MFLRLTRKEVCWALYDWGNSAFATVVLATLFPLMLRDFWSDGLSNPTTMLGMANTVAGGLVALLAPLCGAIGDRRGNRCRMLMGFAALGIVSTGLLAAVPRGAMMPALALFVFGVVGFAGANTFYDGLLIAITHRDRFDIMSSIGYSLGYLGGGIFFAGIIFMLGNPARFGLADAAAVTRVSFVLVAAWWLIFTIPLLLTVKDTIDPTVSTRKAVSEGVAQLVATFSEVRKNRTIFLFLLAYFFYIDGINTVMKMAVDFGAALNLPKDAMIKALLLTQFVGFPAAIVYGRLGEKIGAARGILIGIGTYAVTIIWASQMSSSREFYMLAGIIGLVQGGVQALSRSMFASLIPSDKASEFFGFYNMLGKLSSVMGPFLMAVVSAKTGNNSLSILSLLLLFGIGGIVLLLTPRAPATEPS